MQHLQALEHLQCILHVQARVITGRLELKRLAWAGIMMMYGYAALEQYSTTCGDSLRLTCTTLDVASPEQATVSRFLPRHCMTM